MSPTPTRPVTRLVTPAGDPAGDVAEGEDHSFVSLPDLSDEPPDLPEEPTDLPGDLTGRPAPRRSPLGGIATIVSRVAKGRTRDVDAPAAPAGEQPAAEVADDQGLAESDGEEQAVALDEPVIPPLPALDRDVAAMRAVRPALRADVTRQQPATLLAPATRTEELPEGRELRRPGSVDLVVQPLPAGRVRPIAQLGDAVEPLVIDDFVTEPAYDPVIGPELAAARTRVGLSVDELADRTRIRPHVIESIEVDDFGPCGGDFYARGHLRTLARVLGQDPGPLLAQFEERYATAPVNARKVFEAELATGMTGSMRSTVGGPNWGLLVAVVLCLVLVWGVVRILATQPVEQLTPAPTLNGSAGVGHTGEHPAPAPAVAAPLHLAVVGTGAGTQVVVRDGSGKVVYAGTLVGGVRKPLVATPPVRVHASDAGAVSVSVAGQDRGPVGAAGRPGTRTIHGQG